MKLPNVPFIEFNVAFTLIIFIIFLTFMNAKKNKEMKLLLVLTILFLLYSSCSLFMRLQLWPSYRLWYLIAMFFLFSIPLFSYVQSASLVQKSNKKVTLLFSLITLACCVMQTFEVFISIPDIIVSDTGIITFVYEFNYFAILYYIMPLIIYGYTCRTLLIAAKDSSVNETKGIKILVIAHFIFAVSLLSQLLGVLFPVDQLGILCDLVVVIWATYYFKRFYPALLFSRSILYGSCILLFLVFTIYAINPLESFLTNSLNISKEFIVPISVIIESGLIVVFYLLLKRFVEFIFIKDEQRNKLRLNKFSNEIANAIKLNDTLELISKLLIEEIELNQVIICLAENGKYINKYSYIPENCNFDMDSVVIKNLTNTTMKISDNKDRDNLLFEIKNENEKEFIKKYSYLTITKVLSENEIIALILTATNNKNDPYSYLNLSFIEMSAGISSLAIKRAILLEQYELEKIKAIEANNSKNIFLANMSHEIRTPLNAIVGFNELISNECKDEELLNYSKSIKKSSSDLITLVDNILDFAEFEDGSVEIVNEEYSFYQLLIDTANFLKPKATEKFITFSVSIPQNFPVRLYGSKEKIKQIIFNVIDNAIKYTSKGSIIVDVNFENTTNNKINIIVQVKDTGIGIKENELKEIFTPFNKISTKDNKTVSGSGLGLWLTQKLVKLMNGKIEVSSTYGEGTSVKMIIEQEVRDNTQISEIMASMQTPKIQEINQDINNYNFIAPRANTLIVDDNSMNVKILQRFLSKFNVNVDAVYSGKECLEITKNKKYDIIFMDIMMPEMDGVETLHNLKQDTTNMNLNTNIIVVTANAVNGAEELYLKEGFDAYTSKPISLEIVGDLLLKYLDQNKIEYK